MRDSAHVGAITAISELRGRFVEAGEAISRTVDECVSQAARTLTWVQGPQTEHWKRQSRKREQQHASAKSDLERAKIAQPDADPRSFVDHNRAIKKTKAAIEEAEQKVRSLKRWSRELERQITLFRGGIRPLAGAAEVDLPRAARWLKALEEHLGGYLAVAPALPAAMDAGDEQTDSIPTRRMGSGVQDSDQQEDPS
jgi:hypothetical protein